MFYETSSRHCGSSVSKKRKLEDLLHRDDPLTAGNRRAQGVQQRRLAGLGAARDEDRQPGAYGGVEERRYFGRQRAEADQVVQPVRAGHELANEVRTPGGDLQ